MSATIGYGLRTRKAEDFEQMAAYATELTREWSLKELGYDMTIRDEEREKKQGFYFQGYYVEENEVMWHDFSGSDKNIPIEVMIEQVSTHFPEMELLFWRSWEGPVDYECSIKNGEVTEIEPENEVQEDIIDNHPASVETKEIEDLEPITSAEAAASEGLPW